MVLPGNHEPTAQFAAWAWEQLGLKPQQVLFTAGSSYVMDEDMRAGKQVSLVLRLPLPLLATAAVDVVAVAAAQ